MSKRSVAKVLSTLPGFRASGAFYIGVCNREVISGYALDAPPGWISIWRFILPAYDRIEFLHMTLGRRIVEFALDGNAPSSADLDDQLKNDWQEFSTTHDCQHLLAYLDRERVEGNYCLWTRYLTYIKVGDLESALRLEPQVRPSSAPLGVVMEARQRSGWRGVQSLLSDWSEQTIARFCR